MVLNNTSDLMVNKLAKSANASVYVPRVSSSWFPPLEEIFKDQRMDPTQDPFKLLLLPWFPEHVRFCVRPLRVEPISQSLLAFP